MMVGAVATPHTPKKRNKKDKEADDKDKTPSGIEIHGGTYSSKDYGKLKPFECTEVRRLREEEKKLNVKVGAVTTSPVEEKPEEPALTEVVKRVQFGRAAHRSPVPKTD